MEKICLITNDVETTSIVNHTLRDKTGEYVLNEGLPRLLALYDKYGVQSTFFFTGHIAKLYPETVRMVHKSGHEIGSHGLTHQHDKAFDVISLTVQLENLRISKEILEDICGEEVISFRAPAGRVPDRLPIALEQTGFRIDSSISSQRFDMFFSFGSLKKLKWIFTPRLPYFTTPDNIFKRGNSPILEIPVSALIFPYIGTFMRIAPALNRMTRNLLYLETLMNNRPFNFLTHPNEFIDEDSENKPIERRGSNPLSFFFGDILRHKLKVRNLGNKAIPIFERELSFFSRRKFEFLTCKQLYVQKGNDYARK